MLQSLTLLRTNLTRALCAWLQQMYLETLRLDDRCRYDLETLAPTLPRLNGTAVHMQIRLYVNGMNDIQLVDMLSLTHNMKSADLTIDVRTFDRLLQQSPTFF